MLALLKILISAVLIWGVTEVGQRSGKLGGLLLSLPLTSMIALTWLWVETRDPAKVASVSSETLLFVLPSMVFFVALSFVLQRTSSYWMAFGVATIVTLGAYAAFFKLTA